MPRFESLRRVAPLVCAFAACSCTPALEAPDWAADQARRLSRYQVRFDGRETPITEAYHAINRACKANLVLDPRFYQPTNAAADRESAVIPLVTPPTGEFSGADALQALHQRGNLAGAWCCGAYYVTFATRLADVLEAVRVFQARVAGYEARAAKLQDWERHILDALKEKTDLENKWGVDIATVVEGAQRQEQIIIWLDPELFAKLSEAEQEVNLSVRGMTVRDVVTLVMASRGLLFSFEAGGIYIAMPETVEQVRTQGVLARQLALLGHESARVRHEADYNLENMTGREIDIEDQRDDASPEALLRDWTAWLGDPVEAKVKRPPTPSDGR